MKLLLRYYGDPVLRKKAEPVTRFDDELAKLTRAMVSCMRDASGIGLAAPQIGLSQRVFVMEIPPEMDDMERKIAYPLVVINPEIETADPEEDELEEGCLSIPEIRGKVQRPHTVRMTYQTVTGDKKELELSGLPARCAQHETDHLNGVLFVDKLGSVKKMAIKSKLKKIKATLADPG